MRLKRSDLTRPGITRVRRGRGFSYVHQGRAAVREGLDELVIPPAWREVWISPDPAGHIQAVGIDEAGRRQYLYHPVWTEKRSRVKFDRMLSFAESLPDIRARVTADLRKPGLCRERVLAGAVRLLDKGCFRIGGESYWKTNGTVGLATLGREHLTMDSCRATFSYPAKHGKQLEETIADKPVCRLLGELSEQAPRRPTTLLAYQRGPREWSRVRSTDINAYLKEAAGRSDVSAKDFRTWSATVIVAAELAGSQDQLGSVAKRKRAVAAAVRTASEALGNTPAVCRRSYVDPRVIDRYEDGETIDPVVARGPLDAVRGLSAAEQAVLDLLRG